jgi:hypothetical protein
MFHQYFFSAGGLGTEAGSSSQADSAAVLSSS